MDFKIIKSPSDGVVTMIQNRLPKSSIRVDLKYDSIGLLQGKLSEMLWAADIAEKAADVTVEEIMGICPQHIAMIAIMGDTFSVETAIGALKAAFNETLNEGF